ncbi:MAG: ABC transporter substrate-binding protein [Candidatus Methylomirabilia bacterium]
MTRCLKLLARLALVIALPALGSSPANAANPYEVGVTAAISGGAATMTAPMVEVFGAYIRKLNAEGGVNGHPVKVIYEDDRASPARAATNARKLVEQDKVVLLVNTSLSSTFKPTIAMAKDSKTPLLFGGAVCPKAVFPPADPLLFCSTSFAALLDSEFAARFIHESSTGKVRLGLAGMDIPVVRVGLNAAEAIGKNLGMEVVDKAIIPRTVVDFTPFASKLKAANWVFAWSPWPWEIGPYEALAKLGWRGNYFLYAFQPLEATYGRLNTENLYALSGTALLAEGLPELKAIKAVAADAGVSRRIDLEGWVAAVAVHEALKACGWPCSREKLRGAMSGISFTVKGVKGGPIRWTRDNHFRTEQWYKVYRWDSTGRRPVVVKDWSKVDVEQKLKELR